VVTTRCDDVAKAKEAGEEQTAHITRPEPSSGPLACKTKDALREPTNDRFAWLARVSRIGELHVKVTFAPGVHSVR
jgi:hypothetical protein